MQRNRTKSMTAKIQGVQVSPCQSLKKGAGELKSETEALWQAGVPAGVTAPPSNRIVYGRDEQGLRTTCGKRPRRTAGEFRPRHRPTPLSVRVSWTADESVCEPQTL